MGYLPIAGRNFHRSSQHLWPKSYFYTAKLGAEEEAEEARDKKTFLEVIEIGRDTSVSLIVGNTLELNPQGWVIL